MPAAGPASLPEMSGHTAVMYGNRCVMFGGILDKEPYCNEVWTYDFDSSRCEKAECQGRLPAGVFGHTATLVPGCLLGDNPAPVDAMVVHGGKQGTHVVTDQTFALALGAPAMRWHQIAPSTAGAHPATRWGHSAVLLADIPTTHVWRGVRQSGSRSGLLIFAGDTGEAMGNDLVVFDPTTAVWTPLETRGTVAPRPRRKHSAGLHRNFMYTFGGRSPTQCLQDTWRLNLDTLCWQSVDVNGTIPSMRTGHAFAWHQGRMLVFGGFEYLNSRATLHGDTLEFDAEGEAWSLLSTEDSDRSLTPHEHESCADPPRDASSSVTAPQMQRIIGAPGQLRGCLRPYPRTMAVAVVHAGRLYVHGGRDRSRTFSCAFYLPLRPRHRSLQGLVMQFLVDHGGEAAAGQLPVALRRELYRLPRSI